MGEKWTSTSHQQILSRCAMSWVCTIGRMVQKTSCTCTLLLHSCSWDSTSDKTTLHLFWLFLFLALTYRTEWVRACWYTTSFLSISLSFKSSVCQVANRNSKGHQPINFSSLSTNFTLWSCFKLYPVSIFCFFSNYFHLFSNSCVTLMYILYLLAELYVFIMCACVSMSLCLCFWEKI